jgi:shikimate kinase
MKSICLIGFMGSGKTTIGKALADELNLVFFDTDAEIEKWRGMDIPAIFELEGERAFRDYETAILEKMPKENAVIATGGGIVEKYTNRKWIKQHFYVIYLETSFEAIDERLSNDTNRPLWNQNLISRKTLYDKRKSLYRETCHQIVVNDKQPVAVVVKQLLKDIMDKNSSY